MPRNNKKKGNNKPKKRGGSGQGNKPRTSGHANGPAPAPAPTPPLTRDSAAGDGGGGPFWSLSSTSPATNVANAMSATSGSAVEVTIASTAPTPAQPPPPPVKAAVGIRSGTDAVNLPKTVADGTTSPSMLTTAGTKVAMKTSDDNHKHEKQSISSFTGMADLHDDAAAEKLRRMDVVNLTIDKSDRRLQTKTMGSEATAGQQRKSQRMSGVSMATSAAASMASSFMDDLEEYAIGARRRREQEGGDTISASTLGESKATSNDDDIVKLKAAATTRPPAERVDGLPPPKYEASRMEHGDQLKERDQQDSKEKAVSTVACAPNTQTSNVAHATNATISTTTATATTSVPQRVPSSDPPTSTLTVQPRRAVSSPVGAFQIGGRNSRGQAPRRNTEVYANSRNRPSITNEYDNLAQPSTEFRTSAIQRNNNDNSNGRRPSKIDDKNPGEHDHDGHVIVPEATLVEEKELAKAVGNVEGDGEMLQLTKEEFELQLQTKLHETISNQVVAEATKMEEGEVGSGDQLPNKKTNMFTNGIICLGVSIILIIVVLVSISVTRNKNAIGGSDTSSPITYNDLRYEELKSLLVEDLYPNYSDSANDHGSRDELLGLMPLDDPSTPQFQAFHWLLSEDDPEYIDSLLFPSDEDGTNGAPSPAPSSNETDDGIGGSIITTDPSTALITSNINSTMITISINETDGTTSIELGDNTNGKSGANAVGDKSGSVAIDPRVVIVERYLAALLYYTTTRDASNKIKKSEKNVESDDWLRPDIALNVGVPTCNWNTEYLPIASTTEHAMGFFCKGVNDAYISAILLGSNNLDGEIMNEIGFFSHLEVMHLDNNHIEGSVPSTISQLSMLRELVLSDNDLQSIPIMTLKSALPALDKLHLNSNSLIAIRFLSLVDNKNTGGADVTTVGNTLCQRSNLIDELIIDCLEYSTISDVCPCCTHCCDRGNSNTGNESCAKTRYKQFHDVLSPISSMGALDDGSTPQVSALLWLSNVDTFLFNGTATGSNSVAAQDSPPEQLDLQSSLGLIKDRYVLAILYFALDGPNWVRELPYLNSSLSSCDWHDGYYDHCHLNGRVQNINLAENNMRGKLPPELNLLSAHLERFSIVNNEINGYLPTQLGECTELSLLNLEHNNLSGSIPTELSKLTELREITAFNNRFTGTLPLQMSQYARTKIFRFDTNLISGSIPSPLLSGLSNVEIFYLNSNRLSGSIPTEIGQMTDVEELQLSQNVLNTTICSELGLLTKLFTLQLDSNGFQGQLPSEIGQLTFLRNLRFDRNELVGTLPSEIGDLTNLEELHATLNQITSSIPSEYGSLTSLQLLEVDRNRLDGTIPSELGNMSNLKAFRIYRNYITGSLPTEIGAFTSVTDFEPDSNLLTGSIPTEIGLLRDLERVFFGENYFTGTLPSEMGLLSNMELFIFRHTYISGLIPTEFAQLSYLETLSFRHTNITGNVEEVICRDDFVWDGVYADCVEEVQCSCCVNCCTNELCCDREGENCYSNVWVPIHEQ